MVLWFYGFVVLLPDRGGCILPKGWFHPLKQVVLSFQRDGFILFKSGHKTTWAHYKGALLSHLGVVFCTGPRVPGEAFFADRWRT